MTNDNCNLVGLYVDNPDRYKMLVIRRGNLALRAMVVKLDCGDWFVDRQYYNDESLKQDAKHFASEKNWFYLDYASGEIHDRTVLFPGIVESKEMFIVSDLQYTDGEVPWQDTFVCGVVNALGRLDISISNAEHVLDLQIQSGYLGSASCSCCGDSVYTDEIRYNDFGVEYCGTCYDVTYQYCEKCDSEVRRDSAEYIYANCTTVCDDCADKYYPTCEDCNERHPDDQTYYLEGVQKSVCEGCMGNYIVCEDCEEYHTTDDNWYLEGLDKDVCSDCECNYTKCDECSDYLKKSDCLEVDGTDYCENCLPETEVV